MVFHPAERTIILVTGALAVASALLIWWKGIVVGPDFFAFSIGFAALMIGIGQVYRQVRDSERIALVTHVLGLYIGYTVFGALFNTVLLPRPSAPIDATLVAIDAWLGYSWPAMCAWIAQYPLFNALSRVVYQLTLVQLLVAFILLGMVLDRRRLHAAALAMVIATLISIFFWALFPSGGASAHWTLDPEIAKAANPLAGSAYGAEVNRLLREGVSDLSTLAVGGLIGLPSVHTVMGLVSLIAVWPYRVFRNGLLVFSIFLFPAILVHGGHHLVDVIAGAGVTAVSWILGLRIYDAQERRRPALRPAIIPERAGA